MGSDDSETGDDDGDMEEKNECEYVDLEAASEDADASDYGVPQFIATSKDEACDPMGNDDSEAGDDDGDMEDENECEYGDLEGASVDANTSDYGVHQFIAKDEARDPMGSDDAEAGDDDGDMEEGTGTGTVTSRPPPRMPTPPIMASTCSSARQAHDPVGSDDSEAGDDDVDMEEKNECEYGDLEAAPEDADISDYGVPQFIAKDEARDPMCSDGSEAGDDDGDMEEEHKYEYGDLGAASEDADTSDMASTSSSARPSRLWGCRHFRLRRPPVHR